MTQEEIYNIVLNTEWHEVGQDNIDKMFNDTREFSKIVKFWNDNVLFLVYAIRYKSNKEKYIFVITQMGDNLKDWKFDIELDELNINWNNNDLKYQIS